MDTNAASPKVRSPGFPDTNCWLTAGYSSANQVSQRKREGAKSNHLVGGVARFWRRGVPLPPRPFPVGGGKLGRNSSSYFLPGGGRSTKVGILQLVDVRRHVHRLIVTNPAELERSVLFDFLKFVALSSQDDFYSRVKFEMKELLLC